MIETLCAFFGVDPSAGPEQIGRRAKRAYKRLALLHHPDRGGDPAEFRKVQDAYERLKAALAEVRPPPDAARQSPSRAAVVLFQEFREFILRTGKFSAGSPSALGANTDEARWLSHFVDLGKGAGFLSDAGFVVFLDKSLTLPRLYRAWALKSLPTSHPLFRDISRMFCGDVPWNFHGLRDAVEALYR